VSDGLKPGETVVTDGQLMLYPGAKIITRDQMEKMKGKTPSEKTSPAPDGKGRGKDGHKS